MLYDADGILLKSVSNKRWVKNILNEAFPSNVDTPLANFLMNLYQGSVLFFSENSEYFTLTTCIPYRYKNEYFISTDSTDRKITNELKNKSKYLFDDWNLNNIEIIKLYSAFTHRRNGNYDTYIRFRPLLQINVEKKTGFSVITGTIVYFDTDTLSMLKDDDDFNKSIRKKFNLRRINSGGTKKHFYLSDDMYQELEPYIFDNFESPTKDFQNNIPNINTNEVQMEVNQIAIKKKENVNVDTSEDVSVKGSLEWTVRNASDAQNKNLGLKNGIIPEIRTKSLVNDEKYRTLENCCDMVMNNITAMKNNLSIFGGESKSKAIIIDDDIKDIDFFNRKWSKKDIEDNNKMYPEAISAMESKHEEIIQARICFVYYQMMKFAKQRDYDTNFKHSKGLNYCLHNYPIELSSPMSVIDNAIEWNKLNGKSGLEVLQDVVGLPYGQWRANSYIMYPLSATMPLADSVICLNHKIIKCSTKGGLNGQGAAASLKSLREYVFEGENGQGNITKFGKNIQQQYPNLFGIFDKLTKSSAKEFSNRDWNELYEYIRKETDDLNIDTTKQVQDYINKPLNAQWSKMIMKILESASYDFIQVNATKTSTNSDFHFTYKAQYPAVYNGKVELIIKKDGFSQFHIL